MRYPILPVLLIFPQLQAHSLEIRFTDLPAAKQEGNSEAFFGEASKFPSSNWESQAQPLGNGRIGAMVFGNPIKERIQFNDASLWTDGSNPSGGYDVNEFGAYQNFGDLFIEMNGMKTGSNEIPHITNYSRSLDLDTATHLTTWKHEGVTSTREAFASRPDQAIVIFITADQPGKVAGSVRLKGGHDETVTTSANETGFAGVLSNGLRNAARVKITAEGGETRSSGDGITFSGNSATITPRPSF